MYGIKKRLNVVQRSRSLSYSELAALMSESAERAWHKETVRKYQAGLVERVPADYLHDFCVALDINPIWLLTGEGFPEWRRGEEDHLHGLAAPDWLRFIADSLDARSEADR